MPRRSRDVHSEGLSRNASRKAGMAKPNLLCKWRVRPSRCHVSADGRLRSSCSYAFSAAGKSPASSAWRAGESVWPFATATTKMTIHAARTSEAKLQPHLDRALVVLCPGDTSEVRRSHCGSRIAKIHDIEGVESFGPVLQTHALGEPEILEKPDIEILESRSAQNIATEISECVLRRYGEGVRIEIEPTGAVSLRPA